MCSCLNMCACVLLASTLVYTHLTLYVHVYMYIILLHGTFVFIIEAIALCVFSQVCTLGQSKQTSKDQSNDLRIQVRS